MPMAAVFPTPTTREDSAIAHSDDDAVLLSRYATRGDVAAIEELLRRHLDFLYRTALRWHGRAPDAEDAVQTTLVHVLQQARQFREQGSVRSWLLSILLNVLRRHARDTQAQRTREEAMHATRSQTTMPEAPDQELVAAALKSVEGLPQHYRMPVSLHFLEQMTMRDVAAALAIPEKTVRSQISRGLELLRESLSASGYAVALPALPGLLSCAQLASAPAALSSSLSALIAQSAVKAGVVSAATGAGGKGVAAVALKAGVPALLALGVLATAIHFSRGPQPVLRGDAPPTPAPAPVPATPPAPTELSTDLNNILAQKVDVNFWREYPFEALKYLKGRTGLPYVCSEPTERACTFELKQSGITVKEVLDKIAQLGGLEVEIAHNHVLVWKKADETRFAELTAQLKSSDRWARATAAWELSHLGDKRVPPLLLEACGDKDPGVGQWAMEGLFRHLDVLPYLDVDKSAARIAAERRYALDARQEDNRNSADLLGALSTPEATKILLEAVAGSHSIARQNAIRGLGYDRHPDAVAWLFRQAAHLGEVSPIEAEARWNAPEVQLVEALGFSDDPRAVDVLVRAAQLPLNNQTAKSRTQNALFALATLHSPQACSALAKLLQQRSIFDAGGRLPAVFEPHVLDVLATYLNDKELRRWAAWALLEARDPRSLETEIAEATDRSDRNARWPSELGALRDPRGEAAALQEAFSRKPDLEHVHYDGSATHLLLGTRDPRYIDTFFQTMKDATKELPTRLVAAASLAMANLSHAQTSDLLAYLRSNDRALLYAALFHGNLKEQYHYIQDDDSRWAAICDELTHDADPDVRRSATVALIGASGPRAMQGIVSILKGNDLALRGLVLSTIVTQGVAVRCGDPQLADALAELLKIDDNEASGAAACALGAIHDPRAPVDRIAQLARVPQATGGMIITYSGQCAPRAVLIELSLSGSAEATRAILALLRVPKLDPDFMEYLLATGSPTFTTAIRDVALDPTVEPGLRIKAASQTLWHSPDPAEKRRMLDILTAHLDNDELETAARGQLVSQLVNVGSAKELDAVFSALRKTTLEAAPQMVGDLAYVDPADKRAFGERLVKFIQDETVDVNLRVEAAGALLKLKDEKKLDPASLGIDPVDALERFSKLTTTAETTRERMWYNIMESKDSKAEALVKGALIAGTFEEKLCISSWLTGSKQDEKALDVLISLLKVENAQDADKARDRLKNDLENFELQGVLKDKIKAALDAYAKAKGNPFEDAKAKDGF